MFDIVKKYPKIPAELIGEFAKLGESASINECLPANGALQHDFRPVWPGQKAIGSAFTVRARPGDNLLLHKAITLLSPGDVLVVTCDGFREAGGMWGGIMSLAAKTMGAAGMIIDGCVRDTVVMKKVGFQVWSRGISVKSSTKLAGGKINHPITIGNVPVNPGDLVFADDDGVVIVPREQAADTLKKALKREESEEATVRAVEKDGTHLFFNNPFHETFAKLGLSEEP